MGKVGPWLVPELANAWCDPIIISKRNWESLTAQSYPPPHNSMLPHQWSTYSMLWRGTTEGQGKKNSTLGRCSGHLCFPLTHGSCVTSVKSEDKLGEVRLENGGWDVAYTFATCSLPQASSRLPRVLPIVNLLGLGGPRQDHFCNVQWWCSFHTVATDPTAAELKIYSYRPLIGLGCKPIWPQAMYLGLKKHFCLWEINLVVIILPTKKLLWEGI